MKDFLAPDVYRYLSTQILPGLVASSTWIIALYDRSPGARDFLTQSTPIATGSLVLAAVFWGFVCEDFGSRFEVWIHAWQTRGNPEAAKANWYAYLRTAYVVEPVGIRYIRTLVTRMKFELNAASALITAAIGVKLTFVSFINPWWLFGALLVVAFYLIFEGWTTIRLLREMRKCMRQPITVIDAGR